MIRRLLLTCPLIASFAAGCSSGGGDPNRRETVPVTGTVTFNGQPVEGATVTFVARQDPISANGLTDAQGRFTLTTYEEGDGAVVGVHDVAVNKTQGSTPPVASMDEDPSKYTPGVTPPPVVKHLIPERYSQATTSGLKVTVEQGGKNDFDLVVTN